MVYDPRQHKGSKAEKSSGFELVPEGVYRFRVVSNEVKTYQSGDPYWMLKLQPIEPAGHDDKDIRFFLNFPEFPSENDNEYKKKLKGFNRDRYTFETALGMSYPVDPESATDASRAIGKIVKGNVVHEQSRKAGKDGKFHINANIKPWDLDPDPGAGQLSGGGESEAPGGGFGSNDGFGEGGDIPF